MTAPGMFDADTELRDIQGGLIGFNKDHQRLLPVSFPDQATAAAVLQRLLPLLSSGWEVLHFNGLYSELRQRGNPAGLNIVQSEWTNLWLSADGLNLLAPADLASFPQDFRDGMAARKADIGDVGASDPENWPDKSVPHAIIVIATDTKAGLEKATTRVTKILQASSITAGEGWKGNTRSGRGRGFEHFGFKDGISQPSIAGFTEARNDGSGTVAPGEFLLGYADQDGNIAGQAAAAPLPPPPAGYPAPTPPTPTGLPSWSRNGSFVVFRKLQQNVGAFREFAKRAPEWGLNPEQLGAKLVGRWPSGAPMEPDNLPAGTLDPGMTDPTSSVPGETLDALINNFTYDQDADGRRVPIAAHIRKVNPRSEALPDGERSNSHRMLRRGIPYGPDFADGEPAYEAAVPPEQDRGLLFVCYQSSITRGFETVQAAWANQPSFSVDDSGQDPIISQNTEPRTFHLKSPQDVHLTIAQWVKTTGGGYFFSPSISAVAHLTELIRNSPLPS